MHKIGNDINMLIVTNNKQCTKHDHYNCQ